MRIWYVILPVVSVDVITSSKDPTMDINFSLHEVETT